MYPKGARLIQAIFTIKGILICFMAVAQGQPKAGGHPQPDSVKTKLLQERRAAAAMFAKTQLTVLVTHVANKRYGYYIMANGNILIDQKNIPAVNGNIGFVSEAEAKRTAELAIKKLKQGDMPPTITVADLKKLKVTLPSVY